MPQSHETGPSSGSTGRAVRTPVPSHTLDAAMAVARALVAISVQSAAEIDDQVTMIQLRTLTVVQARGHLNLSGVAALTGTHTSNASRTCDRLVTAGLLTRRDDPDDRRNVQLELTAAGRKLVTSVMRRRRRLLSTLLSGLTPDELDALTGPLQKLADLTEPADPAGHSTRIDEWSGAWTTAPATEPAAGVERR